MPAEIPRRVLGYARVSSVEQTFGQSLEEQQASIAACAKARGLKVARFFVEAESGGREKIEHREQMRLLLREARRGDLVLVDKLDRWSRDPEFTYRSVRELLERGASMYFVAEDIDPSTRDGDTHLNFRILFAREEHKRIRERTVGAMQKLRQRGYFVTGKIPFGYRKSPPKTHRDLERHVLVHVPKEAETVRKIFESVARGRPLAEVGERFKLGRRQVYVIIHNRVYLGELRTKRRSTEWMKGLHAPIVSPSLFDRANKAVSDRLCGGPRTAQSATWDWILRDIARCAECGAKMVSAYGSGGPPYKHVYYACFSRCERGNSYVPVRRVEPIVVQLVDEHIVRLAGELAAGAEPTETAAVTDFAAKRAAVERRRAKHIEAHANEVITLGDLRAQLSKLDIELEKINAAEAATGAAKRSHDPVVRRQMLKDVKMLQRRWRGADPMTQREIVNQLAKRVRLAKGVTDPVWRSVEELAEDLGR